MMCCRLSLSAHRTPPSSFPTHRTTTDPPVHTLTYLLSAFIQQICLLPTRTAGVFPPLLLMEAGGVYDYRVEEPVMRNSNLICYECKAQSLKLWGCLVSSYRLNEFLVWRMHPCVRLHAANVCLFFALSERGESSLQVQSPPTRDG